MLDTPYAGGLMAAKEPLKVLRCPGDGGTRIKKGDPGRAITPNQILPRSRTGGIGEGNAVT